MTTAPPAKISGERLLGLDSARGVAILLVIGHHAALRFEATPDDPIASVLKGAGWLGVDLFFALSGFLIASILMRDARNGDISGFFVRRAFRIIPLFAVALSMYAAATWLVGFESELLGRLWISALMLTGWAIPFYGADGVPYTITWSLSVEEFAYLLLGASALMSAKALRRAAVLFVVVALLVRLFVVAFESFPVDRLYYFVPARLDAIGLGAFGAFGLYSGMVASRLVVWLVGLVVCLLIILYSGFGVGHPFLATVGYSIFSFACGLWVAGLAVHSPAWAGLSRPLAAVGKVAYFLYLFHLFFIEGVSRIGSTFFGVERVEFWQGFVIATVFCYVAALVSWKFFEAPLIKFAAGRTLKRLSGVVESGNAV